MLPAFQDQQNLFCLLSQNVPESLLQPSSGRLNNQLSLLGSLGGVVSVLLHKCCRGREVSPDNPVAISPGQPFLTHSPLFSFLHLFHANYDIGAWLVLAELPAYKDLKISGDNLAQLFQAQPQEVTSLHHL